MTKEPSPIVAFPESFINSESALRHEQVMWRSIIIDRHPHSSLYPVDASENYKSRTEVLNGDCR